MAPYFPFVFLLGCLFMHLFMHGGHGGHGGHHDSAERDAVSHEPQSPQLCYESRHLDCA
ncbi:MAG TPA: DUF2933 domain-containing protein [Candidatus Paceibacterota bacterium]